MRKASIFLIFSLIFSVVSYADVGQDTVVSRGQFEDLQSDPDAGSGSSMAPIVGYEPTFGFVVGGAYFFDSPTFSAGINANTNFKKVYQANLSFVHRVDPRWEYGAKAGITQGYDPYYGMGGETRAEDFSRLWGLTTISRAHLAYKPSSIYSVGVFVDLRSRTEVAGEESPVGGRQFPDDTTAAIGFFQKVDTRRNKVDPKDGFVFGTDITVSPKGFSSHAGQEAFAQIEGDFIVYKEILDGVIPDVIAAFQVTGGISAGNPSYMYEYRLGGANAMRGYLENRFRGQKYYKQQTELRFPILQPFSGAAFIGFGDVTESQFTNPKLAYGVGLRIGLPPDFVSKIRIDVGFGRDQYGVFANFGQTF